ncbi:hypothetical protein G9A89_007683, partial [Geosiphon pyriformis]
EHSIDLRTITMQAWNDLLPILQDNVKRLESKYSPPGYVIAIPIGKEGAQDQPPHFQLHLVPKYKKD